MEETWSNSVFIRQPENQNTTMSHEPDWLRRLTGTCSVSIHSGIPDAPIIPAIPILNRLQAEIERRYYNGLAFQVFYSFTRSLTTTDAGGFSSGATGNAITRTMASGRFRKTLTSLASLTSVTIRGSDSFTTTAPTSLLIGSAGTASTTYLLAGASILAAT